MRNRRFLLSAAIAAAGLGGSPSAAAAPASDGRDCFDAAVRATIVRQTPTPFPEFDDGSIVMRWPWVLELNVERSGRGRVPGGRLTVLTMQHAHYRTHLGARRWLLRRNELGIFNVVEKPKGARLPRCPRGTPPDAPYIRPADGKTLDEIHGEGEAEIERR